MNAYGLCLASSSSITVFVRIGEYGLVHML